VLLGGRGFGQAVTTWSSGFQFQGRSSPKREAG